MQNAALGAQRVMLSGGRAAFQFSSAPPATGCYLITQEEYMAALQLSKRASVAWLIQLHTGDTVYVLQLNDRKGTSSLTNTWEATAGLWLLTSVSGPLSAPGQQNVTNSWHLLWTTKQQTAGRKETRGAESGKWRGIWGERFGENEIHRQMEKDR